MGIEVGRKTSIWNQYYLKENLAKLFFSLRAQILITVKKRSDYEGLHLFVLFSKYFNAAS